jgi:hypothetical protein
VPGGQRARGVPPRPPASSPQAVSGSRTPRPPRSPPPCLSAPIFAT